jgi:hypothetical protein
MEIKELLKLITIYGTAMHGAGRMDALNDIDKYNQYMNESTVIFNKISDILKGDN